MTENIAYIGLGSNLDSPAGSPNATLSAAISRLRVLGEVKAQSSIYVTEPVGYTQQPKFCNAAVALQTSLGPLELLRQLLVVEHEFGRDRGATRPKGPRTLDLDLLMFGDEVVNLPELTVPHPALAERRFVLKPLAEIAPNTIHPTLNKTIDALLQSLPDEDENRVSAVNIS
ncbi:2-amino-4-hydroxy-6-hydroxymethyldihydropteridine diphosphokinase [Acidisarcina polymorpha]|nr:2-amino-4-hydroxy-6-hydroxymethyldihydropteridine diphosphokinase [Acidisarcina polymorpha]